MDIVFTGGTSFTGVWFVQELTRAGHRVWAPLKQKKEAYTGLRKSRLEWLESCAYVEFDCPFGSDPFFSFLGKLPSLHLFCHHAADVTDYKSPDFNVAAALENNTKNLKKCLGMIKEKGCGKLLLTGTVFEPGEGAGSDNLRAVSPYGLSKGLTSAYFKYYTEMQGVKLKKFVIPNPFGPLEEIRFTTFLAKNWLARTLAPVTQPAYVRDNIPVSLLSKAYLHFAENDDLQMNPSGYVESQGTFASRFQIEMKKRLQVPCELEFKTQTEFPEPRVRINTHPLTLNWDERKFWDDLAAFYLRSYGT